MKNFIICSLFTVCCLANKATAQNMGINTNGALPDASAMVDIASTTKGFLAPRMTTTQQNAISLPANGLLIFNTTDNLFRVNTGTPAAPVWTALSSATNNWLLTGNSGSNSATNFLGTIDKITLPFRTNNIQRMLIDSLGRVGIGVTNPSNPLVVKDTFEIRRTGSAISQLLFSNTSGSGDFRIAGDGGDIFWQGGGSRNLQMGSYWGMTLAGDRQTSSLPSFLPGVANTGVLVQAQRDVSVPLAIQGNSASQSANLTEWRNSAGTILNTVNKNGNVAIGSSIFNTTYPEKLLVDAGVTTSVNAIVGKGNINSYLQLNIQNNSTGALSSSDVVATANNGDETNNYVDMGINGGNNNSNVMGTANDAYLYNLGQNFLLGTGSSGKALMFLTGGTDSATNERMRIDGTGNVGIGVANPTNRLQVNASSNPLKLGGLVTGANTDSILTVSNGVVRRLSPSAIITSSSNAWGITGNASTNPTSNFIGTTDAQALVIKENNTQVGRFEANSIALGNAATINNATHSYSFGSTATIGWNKTAGMALGNNSAINADSSFALGTAAVVNGTNSFAIGNGAASNSSNSLAVGRNASTAWSITDGVAIGTNATANSSNSIAIGSNTTSASKTATNAASAIALGNAATSNSTNAIAIGTGATTGYNLTNPVAIGKGSTVNGSNGVAIGNGANISYISNATVLGAGASATSTANNSTAIGYNTGVTKSDEIILGDMTNTALSVGIGSENFSSTNREKLLVDAGVTTSVNAIVGKGNINSYLQLNIQNNSAGALSSSDVVATANNGDETNNYVDMGINGGSNTSNIMGVANDAYLYNMGQNFLLGTGTSGKGLMFLTGGTDLATNERMRIDGSGNVGIGVKNPGYKLQVNATSDPLKLVGLQTGSNTDSVLTVSNGVVKRLSPSALITNSSNVWGTTGNSGTSYATNYIGTNDNKSFRFRTNGIERMIIDSSAGYVGIGSANFDPVTPEQLLVDGGTAVNNIINAVGNQDSYVQVGVQNKNNGSNASSDIVATNNYTANGTTYPYYVDLGINSAGYNNNNASILNQPNTAYIYSVSPEDFYIGNGSANKGLVFFTYGGNTSNGNNSADGTERMRLTSTGRLGIGDFSTGAPAYFVTVKGTIAPFASTGGGSGNLGSTTNRWGTVYATNALNTSSDRRLKTNIKNLNYGLKEVMAMQPVSYNWKTTPNKDKKLGLIAQDVRKIVPEVVHGNEKKENLSMAYSDLIPVLINAIKDQQQQIEELKKTVQELKEKK